MVCFKRSASSLALLQSTHSAFSRKSLARSFVVWAFWMSRLGVTPICDEDCFVHKTSPNSSTITVNIVNTIVFVNTHMYTSRNTLTIISQLTPCLRRIANHKIKGAAHEQHGFPYASQGQRRVLESST